MPSRLLRFTMPASSARSFEAFHNYAVRKRWDTLVSFALVEGGYSHPYVGAITYNRGQGWKKLMSMNTRFVSYDPPNVAAAVLTEPMGIFHAWGASMRHRDINPEQSELLYTFSIKLRPRWLSWLLDPVAEQLFAWETRRRFRAMARFLAANKD